MEKLTKFTIAHIDDDPIVLDMAKMVLEQSQEFKVKSYSTAEQFLGTIRERGTPDLIIVDYFLNSRIPSAMSGSKLIEIFRSQNDQIAVIVVSSQKNMEVALDLIRLRVVDYIVKTDDFTKKIIESVAKVFEMKIIDSKKKVIKNIMLKDKQHLITVALLFLASVSLLVLAGLVFL